MNTSEQMNDMPVMSRIDAKEKGAERGKALRKQVPRKSHAAWTPSVDRSDPVELLRSQGESRVQALLPLRYERMSVSAFTFYRGAALIMASDLVNTPTTGITVQLCGDAHISNFGLFSSPERRTVFDINDFDETLPGPWEWDVKRLAASVEICGRDNGFTKKERRAAVLSCVQGYREGMVQNANMGNLDVWYAHVDADSMLDKLASNLDDRSAKNVEKLLAKAKGKNSERAVKKMTEVVDGKLRIICDPPLIVPLRDLVEHGDEYSTEHFDETTVRRLVRSIIHEYRSTLPPYTRQLIDRYTVVDIAHKVVGVGSVGMRAWMVVMQGADERDPLVLQVKEAQESVLERFLGRSNYEQHGKRVVMGQCAMQTASDILLGWTSAPVLGSDDKEYYVRQLWDGKGSFDLSMLDADKLAVYARGCGWILAHAHARTGDRFAIAGYLGTSDTFDKAIAKFAAAYADQNELDYQRFLEAQEVGEL